MLRTILISIRIPFIQTNTSNSSNRKENFILENLIHIPTVYIYTPLQHSKGEGEEEERATKIITFKI